jgi:hypothetical protein
VNACNFDVAATCDDGSCHFDVSVDVVLSIGSSDSVVFNDISYGPGIYTFTYEAINGCDSLVTVVVIDPAAEGCTDANACNYDPTVGIAVDSLCVYPGCMDVSACNYDENAACDGAVCYFDAEISLTQLFTSAFIFNDSLIAQPGVYEFELTTQAGCDSLITLIVLDPLITDCADSSACNYNPLAGVVANFMCVYPGCTDSLACNYSNAAGCSDNSCSYPGCMNVASCNYDIAAGCDDGSCTFPGCTSEAACNYDVNAGCDDGSCEALLGALCDDGDSLTVGDSIAIGCLCVGDSVAISVTESLKNDLLIYPNPADDRIYIQMSGLSSAMMQIISLTGELIYSGRAVHELMVNQFNPGIYLLQIDYKGIRSNRRIEIIR